MQFLYVYGILWGKCAAIFAFLLFARTVILHLHCHIMPIWRQLWSLLSSLTVYVRVRVSYSTYNELYLPILLFYVQCYSNITLTFFMIQEGMHT